MDNVVIDRPLNVTKTAQRLGVSVNTVRNWEKRGLMRSIRLVGSGFRRFDIEEVERVRSAMWGEDVDRGEFAPPGDPSAKSPDKVIQANSNYSV